MKRCSPEPGHKYAGVVSIKHVYEIAKFKIDEINCAHFTMREMCINVLNAAKRCGIKVVKHDLDSDELGEFLEERAKVNQKELEEVAQRRAAKMMRTAAAAAAAAASTQTPATTKK